MPGSDSEGSPSDWGMRIENSQDAAQLRWLVEHAEARAIRLAAARLSTRRRPRPQQVIAALGLERRARPREQQASLQRAQAHALGREHGWYPEGGESLRPSPPAGR